jgi:hypothetical protein
MDCSTALLLISDHQDGALSKDSEAALEEHIAGCSTCARELAIAEKLSRTLRDMGLEEVQAPPALCNMVMAKVRAERRGILRKLPLDAWRRAVAVAAAALLIACGSAGVNAGLKLGMGSKMLGFKTTSTETDAGSDKGGLAQDNSLNGRTSWPNTTTPLTIENNSSGNTGTGNETGNNTITSSVPSSNDSSKNQADIGRAPGNASSSTLEGQAFLSSEIKVESTVLKIAVDSLAGSKAETISLASDSGAVVQAFPEQNNGNKNVLFMRITVATEQGSNVIAGLEGMGTLLDRQDESRDVTSLYNETLVQYHDLQYRISTENDVTTRQQLEAQALSYKQQLDAWTNGANKRVINLWLESN